MKLNTLELAKKLVSIPSYVEGDVNEGEIGQFVFEYLQQFKWLKVKKQKVADNRFNIIATDNYPTKTIFCGHLDTVQIRSGWDTPPLTPTEKSGKLYGLGVSDMKANIAAMLSALNQFQDTKGLMLFFYIDEEYDFLGMKKFISEYKTNLNPNLIVSGDGCAMQICNGCRGLIEITFLIKGVSGHAGRPDNGKNAIEISTQAVQDLKQLFETRFQNKYLGKSTCNLAYIQGGLDLRSAKTAPLKLGREGNNIADLAEIVIDIRPADSSLNAKKIVELFRNYITTRKGKLESYTIRHDYGSWISSTKELTKVKTIADSVQKNDFALGSFGYIDTQMLWKTFRNVPCFTIGAGGTGTAHSPNEWVSLKNLNNLTLIFQKIIKEST